MRANTQNSEVQSRSSRKRTKTLRNNFNNDSNNELSEMYSNYCQASARAKQHQQYQRTMTEQEKKIQSNQQQQNITHTPHKKVESNSERELSTKKDKLIKKLKISNKSIIQQVQQIWQKINYTSQVKSLSNKHRKLVEKQTNYQKISKDLANAYKSIKIRQKQIELYRKNKQISGYYIERLKKLKQDLSERQIIANRLKNEITLKTKQLKQAEKSAAILIQKNEVNQLKLLSEELDHFIEVTKEAEKREQQRVNILKKQYICVKKLQRQLVQKGMSEFELQRIKKQCMRSFPTKGQLQERKKANQAKSQQTNRDQKKEKLQQRTRKKLDYMIHEISLLHRKQTQFNQIYQTIRAARDHYAEMNRNMEQKIRSCEIEYQKLENLNQKLRSKHIQQYRQTKIKSQKLQSNNLPLRKSLILKQKLQLSSQKRIRFKSLPNNLNFQNNNKQMSIVKRKCSFGKGSLGSNKFNDKYVLGNQHRSKRIIGIIIYYQPVYGLIAGINVTYEQGFKGGEYIWRVSDNQLEYKSQSYECGQSYIKDIIPTFINESDKYRLIGLELIMLTGNTKLLGKADKGQSKLNQRQYIGCMSGSMSIININSRQVSIIQELGFQIYQ